MIDEVSGIDENHEMDYDENSIDSMGKSNQDEVAKDDSSMKCNEAPSIRK